MESKELRDRLERLEARGEQLGHVLAEMNAKLDQLLSLEQPAAAPPEVYSADEFAALVGVKAFTVREWLKFGKIVGSKVNVLHGAYKEWRIPHEELLRYRREGLREAGAAVEEFTDRRKRKGLNGLSFGDK